MKKWKQIDSKIILDTKYLKVRKDNVELPSGEKKEWIYWDATDSAMVVGMTKDKKLVLIEQYRYLVRDTVIEFPSGSLYTGESPEEGARREFEEECGYRCGNIVKLGAFYETYGQLNRLIHLFFSNDIWKTKQRLDSGKVGFEDIKIQLTDYDEALELALQNRMLAMGSTLAMLLLKEKIDRNEIPLY